jgi:hypothetical protein
VARVTIEKSSARPAPAAIKRSDEDGVATIGGHVLIAVERAGHDARAGRHGLDEHHTERLATQ